MMDKKTKIAGPKIIRLHRTTATPQEAIAAYVSVLRKKEPISDQFRALLVELLMALYNHPDAVRALFEKRRRGTPPKQRESFIAFDYELTKFLLGKGKSAKARFEVSQAWGLGESGKTVEGIYRDVGQPDIQTFVKLVDNGIEGGNKEDLYRAQVKYLRSLKDHEHDLVRAPWQSEIDVYMDTFAGAAKQKKPAS